MPSARKMLMDIIEPTIERQYGGGLDDAYMTLSERRRRSSAFADPDATSAFANGGLPMIYREAGGGAYDYDLEQAYEAQADAAVQAAADAEAMFNTEDWTTPQAMAALRAAEAPSKGNANTDDFGPGGLSGLGYDDQEIKDIRSAARAGRMQDALDRQSKGGGDIPYLSGNTRYDTTRSRYAQGPLTTQQINQDVIYNMIDQVKARENYERERGDWLEMLSKTGKATPDEEIELETLKGLTYKSKGGQILDRQSGGGLPTIYRQDPGSVGTGDEESSYQDALDMAAQEEFSSYYSDPANIDVEGSIDSQGNFIGGENQSPSLASLVDEGIIDYDEAYNPQGIQQAMLEAERADRAEARGEYQNWYSGRGAPSLDPRSVRSLSERDKATVQSLIDKDKMQGLGIPLANMLERQYGLRTFGKGLRGPLENYSQGSAKGRDDPDYITDDDAPEDVKRLALEFRYAKPGETIQQFANRFEEETGRAAPLEYFGFDRNSARDMNKNVQDVNAAMQANNLRGIGQGLGLFAGIASNPLTGINALTKGFTGERDSEGRPVTSTALGSVYDRVEGGISGLVDKGKEAIFGPGESDFSKAERAAYAAKGISEKEYIDAVQFAKDNNIPPSDFANMSINGKQQPTLEEINRVDVSGSGVTVTDVLRATDNPLGFALDRIASGRPTTDADIARERMTTKDLSREGLLELVPEPSKEREEAPKQESKSFGQQIIDFLSSAGSPAIPDESTNLGSNDTVERKRVAQPTQKEVAAIAQEAAKIPEEVQKTITSAGLLPQYLALIRAGYTAEKAITAIGLPEGTQIG